MTKKRSKAPKTTDITDGQPEPRKKVSAVVVLNAETIVVGAGSLSIVLSILFVLKPLTPILIAASVFPSFYSAMKKCLFRKALGLVVRWAVTIFLVSMIAGGFNPVRTEKSIPLAKQSVEIIHSWITEKDGAPPANYDYLIGGALVFTAATVISGGAVGFIVGALALASSGYAASYLFRQGDNIFHVLLIAMPPWHLSLFVACILLAVPAAFLFYNRFFKTEESHDRRNILFYTYIGSGLLLLSLVFRVAMAGIWKGFAESWTVL